MDNQVGVALQTTAVEGIDSMDVVFYESVPKDRGADINREDEIYKRKWGWQD